MTVRIHRKIESETLHLPELRPLIGKCVEIIVLEEPPAALTPGTGDWDAALTAAEELEDYDFEAHSRQHAYDLEHATDHLP